MRLPGEQISQLLHEADDFHHRVFRITDGEQSKPSFATYPLAGLAGLAPDGV